MNENFEYPEDYDVYWEKWIDIYEQRNGRRSKHNRTTKVNGT